jgi:hypothetical protein
VTTISLCLGSGINTTDTQNHPEVRFRTTNVTDADDHRFHVEGELEAAGERHEQQAGPIVTAPVKWWNAFRALTQLSFPRSYPIVQFPNAPLILAFASGILAQSSHGRVHADAQAVSYLAMAVWAYLELFQGVNSFRRLLGLAYTISTAIHLAIALSHH